MHVRFNSTRKTAAGMFRAGMVYMIGKDQPDALDAVTPHIEAGTAEKLTAAEAKKAGAAMLQDMTGASAETPPEADDA